MIKNKNKKQTRIFNRKIFVLALILVVLIFVIGNIRDIVGGQKFVGTSHISSSHSPEYEECISNQSLPEQSFLRMSSVEYQDYAKQRLEERQKYAKQLEDQFIDVIKLPNGSKHGWKKYTSTRGYSVEFPENFTIKPLEDTNDSTIFLEDIKSPDRLVMAVFGCLKTFGFSITPPATIAKDLYTLINNASYDPHDYNLYTIKGMNIAAHKKNYDYYFTKNGIMFELSTSSPKSDDIQLFKQIVSTFQIN